MFWVLVWRSEYLRRPYRVLSTVPPCNFFVVGNLAVAVFLSSQSLSFLYIIPANSFLPAGLQVQEPRDIHLSHCYIHVSVAMNIKEAQQAEAYADDDLTPGSKQSMRGTDADARDMQVMGKVQELNVRILQQWQRYVTSR